MSDPLNAIPSVPDDEAARCLKEWDQTGKMPAPLAPAVEWGAPVAIDSTPRDALAQPFPYDHGMSEGQAYPAYPTGFEVCVTPDWY